VSINYLHFSSFPGIHESIPQRGLFGSVYSDRGSRYWFTSEAGDKVDKQRLRQFGRALNQLELQMIPAYSSEARGRSEHFFGTIQGRLPLKLALKGITDVTKVNACLEKTLWPNFNRRFMVEAREQGDAFVSLLNTDLDNIMCLRAERPVGTDNSISYCGNPLQIPKDRTRHHDATMTVRVHEYLDRWSAISRGPPCFAVNDKPGKQSIKEKRWQRKSAALLCRWRLEPRLKAPPPPELKADDSCVIKIRRFFVLLPPHA